MRILLAVVSLLVLAACTRQAANPAGIYRLGTAEKSMVLQVRSSGEYVLHINGRDRNPDEIRGRWEVEERRGSAPALAFHGIVWHGTEPETAEGTWRATVDSSGDLCLDAEGLNCFSKEDAS